MGLGIFVSEMGRKKQGLWEEEKHEIYSANVFYKNTFEIAKVRGPETKWDGPVPLIYMAL